MSVYFNNFTPEAMHALGAGLAVAREQRQALLSQVRSQTHALLAAARAKRVETAAARRESAAHEADARRLFTSELQSEVHALRNRFELARRDTVTDLQHMAVELRAAREAVRAWPGRSEAKPPRHSAHTNAAAASPKPHTAPAAKPHAAPAAKPNVAPAAKMHAAPAAKPHTPAPAAKPQHFTAAPANGNKEATHPPRFQPGGGSTPAKPPFGKNPDPDKGRHG